MKISKKIVSAILMSVALEAMVPGMAKAASIVNIDDTSANPSVVVFNSSYAIDGTTTDSILNITGNNDKTIRWEYSGTGNEFSTVNVSGNGGTVIVNSGNGTVNIVGDAFDVSSSQIADVNKGMLIDNSGNLVFDNLVNSHWYTGHSANDNFINNSGNLTFNNFVRVDANYQNNAIYNTGTINFAAEDSQADIRNTIVNEVGGVIKFRNSSVTLWSNGFGNSGVAVDNKGQVDIDSPSLYIEGEMDNSNPVILNNGIMNINGHLANATNSRMTMRGSVENHGSLSVDSVIDFNTDNSESNKTVVDNYGNLTLKGENGSSIRGDIIHHPGASTNIALGLGALTGRIYGSDDNFSLELENASWSVTSGQVDEVNGLKLVDSSIQLKTENYLYNASDGEPAYPWNDSYDTLKINNLSASGNSFIEICTDLKNDVGDQIILTGTTPEKIELLIVNKDDNGGVPIRKEEGHKVRVLVSPSANDLDVESGRSVKFHNKNLYHDGVFYLPVIETSVDGDVKYWDFLGWGDGGTRTYENEAVREDEDATLTVRDTQTTIKRLNDLRTDPSEVGIWIRGEKGKSKIRNYSYEYNVMSGGYDWHQENRARKLFYGFGLSYSKNQCDDGLIGDSKSMGYNLYGSWVGKRNNDFIDVILKYGKLDKDYSGIDKNNVYVAGKYDKDLFSVAAKLGRRIYQDNGTYFEPQVGYTYGRLTAADFTDNQGAMIHANAVNSHIASLSLQVGKKINGTELYTKVGYVYDFGGKIQVSSGDQVAKDDMGGGYMTTALGAARKVSKSHSFYCEVEKDFGNKVKKPYAVALGYRYAF